MEYYEDDVNKLCDVARSESGVSTIHDATGGDPTSSPRWQANMALGGDRELVAAPRTRAGGVWGAVTLYREPDQPMFDAEGKRFMRQAAAHLAEGARRSLLFGEATDPQGPEAPGLLVLDADWRVESSTPGTERWLARLPDGDANRLPTAVLTVAGQALRSAELGDRPGEVAMARVLSRSGQWVVLHGAALLSGAGRRVAVIVEPAHPARITSLLMSAHQLTTRARDTTRLALQGASTTEIAAELSVSPTPCSNTSRASSTKRVYAAAATLWARCSSRTTSPGCATTRTGFTPTGRSVVAAPADRGDAPGAW